MTTNLPENIMRDVWCIVESPHKPEAKDTDLATHMQEDTMKRKAAHADRKGPPAIFTQELAALFNTGQFQPFAQKAAEAIQRWPTSAVGWKALGNLLLMQGRAAESLEPLSTTVRLTPDDAQALHNLGLAHLQLGNLEAAESNFRNAIKHKPGYFQAYTNLGIVLLELRHLAEAEATLRKAVELKPDLAEAHNSLGNALIELERFEEAEASFSKAVSCRPGFAEAHANLGITRQRLHHPDLAEESYRQALALKPDYPQAYIGLGELSSLRNDMRGALTNYRRGMELAPYNIEVCDGLRHALGQLVPAWHVPMMNDAPRNEAYFQALKSAITPDTNVLEIGTGSGLLAMMAASLGARKITTCEAVTEIAETARAIVADNGFSTTVTVIPKISTQLSVGDDLDERADLLVSEVLSNEFLGEGVLQSFEDAKLRLLKPGARIIPARGSIQFALFGGDKIEMNVRVGEVYGFDLSRFNDLVAKKQNVSRGDLEIELLSDDMCSFFFDFMNTSEFPASDRKVIQVPVTKPGKCCGIIQWIRLEMDDSITFQNHPLDRNPASSWQHCLYLLEKPVEVSPGQVATITAVRNRKIPWFFIDGIR